MFTFLSNLFSILWNIPAAITIIKRIMDFLGSDAVKQILEAISGAVITETTTPTEPRKPLFQRVKERLALRFLGLRDNQREQLLAFCDGCKNDPIA
jgi:hypothetical protein